ncbi:MAG: RDD family protein [Bacteroidota bacterium]
MNRLNAGSRIGSMVIDHITMTFLVMIFAAPGMVYDMMQSFGNPDVQPKLFLGNYYLNIFAFSLYFNKDILSGRSIAKRILKFQIVNVRTNKPANSLRCFIRNLTIIFWPVEVIMGLVNNERRIGDFITGTKLTVYDPNEHKTKVNWLMAIVAILISMAFTYLAMILPVELLYKINSITTYQ